MYFLGLDIGTTGSREIGWAEQDPNDWWRACVNAIKEVLHSGKCTPDEIGAISFSGQMHGSVFLDETDKVIRPALLWCDQRTEKQCVEITEKIGATRLIELVSNPAVTGFTLPKILWLREVEPENWNSVRSILL